MLINKSKDALYNYFLSCLRTAENMAGHWITTTASGTNNKCKDRFSFFPTISKKSLAERLHSDDLFYDEIPRHRYET